MAFAHSSSLTEFPAILLVLDDRDLIELLSNVLESRDYTVCVARSGPSAVAFLRSGCRFDAVLADWDPARGVGESLFQWLQEKRPSLVPRFIALVNVEPPDFQFVTQGRCHLVHSFDLAEIVRVTTAVVRGDDSARLDEAQKRPTTGYRSLVSGAGAASEVAENADRALPDTTDGVPIAVTSDGLQKNARPSLLLVEDEPLQKDIMTERLGRLGFAVTARSSGNAAMSSLAHNEYDVILSDWYMSNGSGAELYSWLVAHRPHLADRCVFMSSRASVHELAQTAPQQPFVPKSAGTIALLGYLTGIAARSRSHAIGFMSLAGH